MSEIWWIKVRIQVRLHYELFSESASAFQRFSLPEVLYKDDPPSDSVEMPSLSHFFEPAAISQNVPHSSLFTSFEKGKATKMKVRVAERAIFAFVYRDFPSDLNDSQNGRFWLANSANITAKQNK